MKKVGFVSFTGNNFFSSAKKKKKLDGRLHTKHSRTLYVIQNFKSCHTSVIDIFSSARLKTCIVVQWLYSKGYFGKHKVLTISSHLNPK